MRVLLARSGSRGSSYYRIDEPARAVREADLGVDVVVQARASPPSMRRGRRRRRARGRRGGRRGCRRRRPPAAEDRGDAADHPHPAGAGRRRRRGDGRPAHRRPVRPHGPPRSSSAAARATSRSSAPARRTSSRSRRRLCSTSTRATAGGSSCPTPSRGGSPSCPRPTSASPEVLTIGWSRQRARSPVRPAGDRLRAAAGAGPDPAEEPAAGPRSEVGPPDPAGADQRAGGGAPGSTTWTPTRPAWASCSTSASPRCGWTGSTPARAGSSRWSTRRAVSTACGPGAPSTSGSGSGCRPGPPRTGPSGSPSASRTPTGGARWPRPPASRSWPTT